MSAGGTFAWLGVLAWAAAATAEFALTVNLATELLPDGGQVVRARIA